MSMPRQRSRLGRRVILLGVAVTAAGIMTAGSAWAASFTFTTTADWATGVLTNTNSAPPPATGDGHVRLDDAILTPFDHIWVALSGRGTVVRIDTNAAPGQYTATQAGGSIVLGEYRTAPQGLGTNPSRTTVDANGDVWVGNRNEASGGQGSVAKISANPTGTTSSGIFNDPSNGGPLGTFNALPWTNAGGADNAGGVSTATDSAQMRYVRTTGTGVRTVAVNADNNVWVGGFNNKQHQLYDGDTGALIPGPGNSFNNGGGGYGGLIDGNGVLWSAGFSNLVKHDPATDTTTFVNLGRTAYGMALDNNGKLWVSNWTSNTVQRIDPVTNVIEGTFAAGASALRGVAVTPDNDMWIAASGSGGVVRLNNDGTVQSFIATGNTPTGVAVDSNGKVWVTNFGSNTVSRIDPTLSGGNGAVDLTISLGANATPYNYSDMTGTVLLGSTIPSGTWRRVLDGGAGATWNDIFWNEQQEGAIPDLTNLTIEARLSDDLASWSSYVAYDSGDPIGLTARYLEVRATLTRPGGSDLTPVLSDLRITFTADQQEVSEPATLGLLGLGLFGLAWLRRRHSS